MLTECRTAILFGLCLVLASCDGTSPDPTAPAEEASALDAATLTASNTWATRRQLPFPLSAVKAGRINNIIYVVGGVNAWGGPRPTLAYDVSTDSWTNRQPLPSVRDGINGVTLIKGKLYVTGGSNSSGQLTRTLFVYDPATNTWARRAELPQPAGCGSQGEIGGLLYVYAGCTDIQDPEGPVPGSHNLFRYNPATNRWVTLPPPPIGHEHGFGAALGNRFYVGGGWYDHAPTGRMHAYDPATNTWADRAGAPGPGPTSAAFNVLGGKLYVAGGIDDVGLNVDDLYVYDPTSNTWTSKASMPTERSWAAGAAGGGRFFVIGGRSGHPDSPPQTTDGRRRVDAYTP
jgi:N-acetylneuraminic acid mutarotase